MKKKSTFALIMLLVISFAAMGVFAYTSSRDSDKDAFALATYTGEYIGEAKRVKISEDAISFTLSKQKYSFEAAEDKVNTIVNKTYYSTQNDDIICNVAEKEGNYCIQVVNTAVSVAGRKADPLQAFSVFVGENIEELKESISDVLQQTN